MRSWRRTWWLAVLGAVAMVSHGTADAFLEGVAPAHSVSGSAVTAVTCDGFLACDTGRSTVTVSIAPMNGEAWGSICDLAGTWCTMSGSLWSVAFVFECSAFDGQTWYGRHRMRSGEGDLWWLFKVVDGGARGDEFGLERSFDAEQDDRCGAGDVRSRPVHSGDFTVY